METGRRNIGNEQACSDTEDLAVWQNKLLPSMRNLVIGLACFFFIATLGQLAYLQYSIRSAPSINLASTLQKYTTTKNDSFQERKELMKLESLILLEANTLERRHHHSHIVLMASIWVRYLAFVTGMILAFIGAIFILGKLEESKSVITASINTADVTLKSASPGIILVVLGSALIITTIIMQHTVTVTDASVYLETETATGDKNSDSTLKKFDPKSIKN
ncbi:MAG: hypothetical protein JWQ25_2374 [Daejeonella sp.]|nr:hypothetical protein [Daejeonella sp.]